VIENGKLQVVDNQVDQSTGTVKLKAEFPNANLELWPGQFVNIRLLIDTLQQVVVIPTGAVQRGPKGTFVYVVKDDNTVTMRPVAVRQQDETQAVVSSGVEQPERVVTSGFARLNDGAHVMVATPGETTSPVPRAPTRDRGQRRGGAGGPPSGAQGNAPNSAGGGANSAPSETGGAGGSAPR